MCVSLFVIFSENTEKLNGYGLCTHKWVVLVEEIICANFFGWRSRMNINCSLQCQHQKEGKCKLKEFNLQNTIVGEYKKDCPYFQNRLLESIK